MPAPHRVREHKDLQRDEVRRRDDRHALGRGHRDDVRQVVLALAVVVGQLGQPALELRRGRRHRTGVDLADRALRRARVALLDDAAHRSAVRCSRLGHVRGPQDPSVPAGLLELDRQQREPDAAARLDQRPRGGRFDQRHIAVEDQGRAVVVECGTGLQDGMAGPKLGHLTHKFQARGRHRRLHRLRAVSRDRDDGIGLEAGGGLQNMLQ